MRIINMVLIIMILVLNLACSDKQDPQNLVIKLGAEPSMLNPVLSTDSASSSVNNYVFSGLLKVNPDMELIPDLAESYIVSEDGMVFTFFLITLIFYIYF